MTIRDEDIEVSVIPTRGADNQRTKQAVKIRHIATGEIVTASQANSRFVNLMHAKVELEKKLKGKEIGSKTSQ